MFAIGTNLFLVQKETQVTTFLNLLKSVKTRKKVFDVALAASLKDNGISGVYTVNVSDFEEFTFLDVRNPLEKYAGAHAAAFASPVVKHESQPQELVVSDAAAE